MTLPKVANTKIRGSKYHFNIPIPVAIQHLYPTKTPGKYKTIFDGTTRTADPKEAGRLVRTNKVVMDRQLEEHRRRAEQASIAKMLAPEDARLLAEYGGVDGVLKALKDNRIAAAFSLGEIDQNAPEYEGGDTSAPMLVPGGGPVSPDTPAHRTEAEIQRQEEAARLQVLTAENRRLKGIAGQLGEVVPEPPKGIDEGTTGIRELAREFCDAKSYTVQNQESVENTVRRWIELHGDIPITKWTRAHLNSFDNTLRDLPVTGKSDVRDLTIQKAVAKGKREGLTPIGYKTRKRYSDHMKALTKYALNGPGTILADPFAGYVPIKEKVKHSKAKEASTISYTPKQVGMIIDHCKAKFPDTTLDYWLPMLAAYTGARREELGQLTVNDYRLVSNMHVLDVTDLDPDQTVKNKHSLRSLTLPSVIVNSGLVDHIKRRATNGDKFIFQRAFRETVKELEPNARGRLTEEYGKRFYLQVRKPLGLITPGMKFHSLRHSWTDAARRAGIDSELRRKIAGRMENEDPVEGGYGDDELLTMKLDALELVAKEVRT